MIIPSVDERDKCGSQGGKVERREGWVVLGCPLLFKGRERRKECSYMMASTGRSKDGEVQPKISPGDRGRHWGTSTSYSVARAALTACEVEREGREEFAR